VYAGLALAVVGLLVALYAYTGTRVYEIGFALTALLGGLLALIGISTAAWGRSIMASRAARSRRGLFREEALRLDEALPTIAANAEKRRRFAFQVPRLGRKSANGEDARQEARIVLTAEPEPHPEPPEPLVTLVQEPVRVTLRCPECSQTFTAEGVRPFSATCGQCGFSATV
jgi:hypothetical protein